MNPALFNVSILSSFGTLSFSPFPFTIKDVFVWREKGFRKIKAYGEMAVFFVSFQSDENTSVKLDK